MILTNLRKNASTVNSYNEAWGNLRLKKHTLKQMHQWDTHCTDCDSAHWCRCITCPVWDTHCTDCETF